MVLKRLAALALVAPLAHLNVARADIACGRHSRANHSDPIEAGMTRAHHADHTSDTADFPTDQTTGKTTECCQALASCSLSLGFAEESRGSTHAISPEGVASALLQLSLSRASGPEPPPPRVER